MRKYILLYWGTVFLMCLSHMYYPAKWRLSRPIIRNGFSWCKSDLFMCAVVIWMTCFSFLRTDYNDTYTYRALFENVVSLEEGWAEGAFVDWTANPFSMLYRSLVRHYTDNYHIYFFFPAVLSSFAIVKMCKRFSVSPGMSLLIFYSMGTYAMYMAALKQSMAIPILIFSIPYALDKKYVRFFLLVILACLFHTHSFMFAVLPLLMGKPWNKVTWLLLAAVLFAMATYDSTLGSFLAYAQSIGYDINEGEVFDGYSINVFRVMVYWVPGILALLFRRRLFRDSTIEENLFVNMSIFSAMIISVGLVEGANMYARMAGYFEIAIPIALPWMIKKLFTKESAKYVNVMACGLYFVFFLYEFIVAKDFNAQYKTHTISQFIQMLR